MALPLQAHLEAAFLQSPDVLAFADSEGRILSANPAAQALGGGHPPVHVDELLEALDETNPRLYQLRNRLGDSHRLELATCRADRHFEITLQRLQGNPALLLVARDTTARQLDQRREARAARFRATELLAGSLAHDLNNLLQAIGGNAALCRDAHDATERSENLDLISEATERAVALMRQLMLFSRRSRFDPEDTEPAPLLESILFKLRAALGSSTDIQLRTPPPNPLQLPLDEALLYKALYQLCTNARDAQAPGSRILLDCRLRLITPADHGLHHAARPGPYLQIDVIDQGCGMDAATRDQCLDPFFTTKPRGKGQGLGLSIAHGIATSHKGFLHLESIPGRGTTASLFLPLQQLETPAAPPPLPVPQTQTSTTHTSNGTASTSERPAVLLAEDDLSVARLARRILERAGFEVIHAHDGQEAWQIFQQQQPRFRAIMVDAIMPLLGGPELIRLVRERAPGLPVIFSSGYNTESLPDDLAPYVTVIQKPFTPDSLVKLMRSLVPDGVTS